MAETNSINKKEQITEKIVNESRMLTDKLAGFSTACRNGRDAPCMGACPYDLDIRAFLKRVQRGNFRSAYNILSDSLLFPHTLCSLCGHACRDACAFEMEGIMIDLPAIESAVIKSMAGKSARKFRVPPKTNKIAVIGAGLSGLAATYSLGSLGYPVTVYEKDPTVGGSLKKLLPEEIFLPELNAVTEADNITLITETEIHDLSELSEFDGIIIASGLSGSSFGLFERENGFVCRDNIFMIGEITGSPATASVIYGRKAGTALDRFLKAGEVPRKKEMPGPIPDFKNSITGSVHRFDKDTAVTEAKRCRMCDCTNCSDICELMRHYKKIPPRFEIDIPGTLNSVGTVKKKSSLRLLMSCDDCRVCEEVCPEGIRTGEALMQVRTALAHDRELPAAFHDFWIRDMLFSCSEDASCLRKPENGYLYFPGCLLGGSDPENVKGSYALLNRILPGCGIFLYCCGIPAKWAGETELLSETAEHIRSVWESCGKPVFVTACPSCRRNLKEYLPEIKTKSIYTFMAEHPEYIKSDCMEGEELTVFHPCSSHFDPEEQESVKKLIMICGAHVHELEDSADRHGCCGYGGHIYYTNPGLYDEISDRRAQSDERPYITYCANCRDILTSKGKETSHILKVLAEGKRNPFPAPSLTERRENRRHLKASLTGTSLPEDTMNVLISAELMHKMDRSLILRSDITEVIKQSENTGAYLMNEDNICIGHLKIGPVTYWVFWEKDGNDYRILNAYSHRMEIREDL